MKQVVWIFGNSAAGKDTFIRHIESGGNLALIEKLGWIQADIKHSKASLKYISQFRGDPITVRRDLIFKEVPKLLVNSNVVLVKWQGVDSEAVRIESLQAILPNCAHRIIQIVTSDKELIKRLPLKNWWDDSYDIYEFIAGENKHIEEWINKLDSRLPVVKISGNPLDDYKLLES